MNIYHLVVLTEPFLVLHGNTVQDEIFIPSIGTNGFLSSLFLSFPGDISILVVDSFVWQWENFIAILFKLWLVRFILLFFVLHGLTHVLLIFLITKYWIPLPSSLFLHPS